MGLLPDTWNYGLRMRRECRERFPPATAGHRSRHASRHVRHARAVMHVGIASQQFPLKSEAEKRSRHSRRMRNPQFWVSGKRSMIVCLVVTIVVTVTIIIGKWSHVQFQPDYNNNATLTTMSWWWGPRSYLRCQKMMILCSSFVELKGLKSRLWLKNIQVECRIFASVNLVAIGPGKGLSLQHHAIGASPTHLSEIWIRI